MTDSISATGLFTGGVVVLHLNSDAEASTWTLTRTYGSLTTDIPIVATTGEGFRLYVDDGYGIEGPLPSGTELTYSFSTSSGTVTASVTLAPSLYLTSDSFLTTIVSAITAAAKTVVLPDASTFPNRATVRQAMPLTQSPPLPLISVEEVAQHQAIRGIGADVNPDSTRNVWVMAEQADLRYHIGVFTRTIAERQFWKSVVLAVLKALNAQLGPVLGQNNTVNYQISQGQIPPSDLPPGFYFAEIGFNISGPSSIVVKTDYDVTTGLEVSMNQDTIPLSKVPLYDDAG